MRLAYAVLPIAVLAAGIAAGCDSTNESTQSKPTTPASRESTPAAPAGASTRSCASDAADLEEVRATGVGCGEARAVATAWGRDRGCASPGRGSRFSCSVDGYRCLGAATDRGIAVSCALPGRSIAFIARRRT